MKNLRRKENKGITLIALVVTIVVLIILAVISVNAVLGENGIIRRAEQAKVLKSHGEVTEGIKLAYVDYEFEQTTGVTAKVEETKLASVKVASARARTETFLEFLARKGYTNENNVVDVVKLLGHNTGIGNGDSESDVYIVEDIDDNYELNYYDKDKEQLNLWVVAKPEDTTTEDEENDELCPDCGEAPCRCGEDGEGEDDGASECPYCGLTGCDGECQFEGEDTCPDCGMDPCECGPCPACGEDPCVCGVECASY